MRVAGVFSALTEVALPSLCVGCGEPLPGGDRGLCGACWACLAPAAGSRCPRCARPADPIERHCLRCLHDPPPQDGTVVWGEHDGLLRTAVVALKHAGRDELARPLGERLAARVGSEPWSASLDVVTAVPSHLTRTLRRGFAAAELLARSAAAALERPFARLLRRHGRGRQSGRTRAQRLELPARAFSARQRVSGRRVLLVDDVTTTGATLRRATAALLSAGADAVHCAALAWAPDPRRLP